MRSPDYTVVEHRGETVACIYDEEVYIADNYPSLNMGEKSYANTTRSNVKFTKDLKTLEDAIDFLLDSPRRLDRETRDKRVENVRKYFQERELKRLRHNELIARLERGEHLSREELRELSMIGYTI